MAAILDFRLKMMPYHKYDVRSGIVKVSYLKKCVIQDSMLFSLKVNSSRRLLALWLYSTRPDLTLTWFDSTQLWMSFLGNTRYALVDWVFCFPVLADVLSFLKFYQMATCYSNRRGGITRGAMLNVLRSVDTLDRGLEQSAHSLKTS